MAARYDGLDAFDTFNDFNQIRGKKTIYRDYKFHKKQVGPVKGKIPDDLFIREKYRNIHSDPTYFNPEDDIQIRGPDVFLPISPEYFKECEDLDDRLRKNLKKLGYKQLTHVQRYIIPLISGPDDVRKDVLLCGRTGSGKTLGYLIAAVQNAILKNKLSAKKDDTDIQHKPCTLIMVQSNHAAEQVFLWANLLTSNTPVKVGSAIGAFNRTEELEKWDTYGADIVVATIGRLTDYLKTYPNLLKDVKLIVFDDAELFLRDENWDSAIKIFRSAIVGMYQVFCPSSGFDEQSYKSVVDFTDDYRWEIDIASLNKVEKRIPQELIDTSHKNRTKELVKQLRKRAVDNRYPKTIVYCNSHETATMVAQRLRLDHSLPRAFRPRVAFLHGGTYDGQSIFNAFCTKKGERTDLLGDDSIEMDVIVACDGFAYGIDAKVELVINFDFPTSLCIYAQRIGRLGRKGVYGEALTLINGDKLSENPQIIRDNILNIIHAANQANAIVPEFLHALMDVYY